MHKQDSVRSGHSLTTVWVRKFHNALRGIAVGIRGEGSFAVHLPVAALVVMVAIGLKLDRTSWSLLTLSVASVMAAELFNTSIERLAKAVDRRDNPLLRDALDIASGAVLTVVIGAVVVGLLVLLPPIWAMFAITPAN